jgi:hypothetical protein
MYFDIQPMEDDKECMLYREYERRQARLHVATHRYMQIIRKETRIGEHGQVKVEERISYHGSHDLRNFVMLSYHKWPKYASQHLVEERWNELRPFVGLPEDVIYRSKTEAQGAFYGMMKKLKRGRKTLDVWERYFIHYLEYYMDGKAAYDVVKVQILRQQEKRLHGGEAPSFNLPASVLHHIGSFVGQKCVLKNS